MAETGPRLGTALRYATVALQVALVGAVVYAATRSLGLVLNTGLPLAIASIPLFVRYRYDYRLNAVLELVVVAGAAFHAFGAIGLYRWVGWYDQVAHGVAGVLVGGTGYALVQVVDTQYDDVVIPAKLRFVFVLVFAMAVGVAWEVGEFSAELVATRLGGDPILAQYGLADVVFDLVFDLVGAVVVGLWGTTYFDDVRVLVNGYVEPGDLGDGRTSSGPD